MAPLFEDAKIPMIAPSSSHEDLTSLGNYIIRGSIIQKIQQQLYVEFLERNYPDIQTVSILHQNDDTGNAVNDEFSAAWTASGHTILDQETFLTGQKDFAAQVSKIQQQNPDAFYVYAPYADAGVIVKQCDDLDFHPQFLFAAPTFQQEFIELANGKADGCVIWATLDLNSSNATFQAFKQKYEETYAPSKLNSHAFCAYDALYLLSQAIEKCKGDRDEMAKFLRNNESVEGVFGPYSISNGDPKKPMFAITIQDGEFVSIPDKE